MADLPKTDQLKCPRCDSKFVVYSTKKGHNICRKCGQEFVFDPDKKQGNSMPKTKPKPKAKKKAITKK